MATLTTITPTAAQIAAMAADAKAFETYAGTVNTTVARRWLWWRTLLEQRGTHAAVGAFDVRANEELDGQAAQWAQVMVSLRDGRAELCTHTAAGDKLMLGVVRAGSVPSTLQAFPFVAVIVAGAAVGVWVLVDAWLTARKLDAESANMHAANQLAATQAIARAKTPDDAKAIADAVALANKAIQGPPPAGIIDRIAQGIANVVNAVTGAATYSALGVALIAYLLLRKR